MSPRINILRSVTVLAFVVLCWGASVSAQQFQTQPMAQQRMQTPPLQQGQMQQQQIQQQPIRQIQPIQAPRYSPQSNPPGGASIYQNPGAQPSTPQGPVGANNQSQIRQVQGGQTLYNPTGVNQTPLTVQSTDMSSTIGQQPPRGMAHVGRAEPVSRIVPFFLNPDEQRELDTFLARWERYSTRIERYDVNVNMHEYDMTIPGAEPNKPTKICFGYFKYIANPMRFVYVVEGEWRDGKFIKRDGDNPDIYAEKTIIAEKAVYKYDYVSKTLYQINVPPEMIGKGIADSPLPLIFGAKADDLKRRFSMKVVTREDGLILLHARPLLAEDQQEFKELQILLEKDLRARGLLQYDINDKGHKVFELKDTQINPRLKYILEDIRGFFTPDKPIGWKLEVSNWVAEPTSQPVPAFGMPQPPIGSPSTNSQGVVPLFQR